MRPALRLLLLATAVGLVAMNGNSVADDGKTNSSVGIQKEGETETLWSLKPTTRPKVPSVSNRKWKPRNPIDNFILAKLADAKLSPSAETDRRTLIRRLTLDLAGVLPSESEIESFVNDNSPDAYQKLVERLS